MENSMVNEVVKSMTNVETVAPAVVEPVTTGTTAGNTVLKIGGGFLGGIAAGIGGTKLVQWLKSKKATDEKENKPDDKKDKKGKKRYSPEEIEEIKKQAVAEAMAELVEYTDDGDPVEEPEQ
jgi:Na+/glutamate symporter